MNEKLNYNRLKNENSLYLKQHADNPIHWWNYGPEAIIKAKEENKPIFLSIGYSSCHWCHVMGKEAFSNLEIADFLNKNFISIKLDKEEFPDIDNYYQQAAQMFGKNGGWPLSVFMLPDLRPYFVGTYFPIEGSKNHGPGFLDIIKELKRAYEENNEQVLDNAHKVFENITKGPVLTERVQYQGHFPAPTAILEATKELRDLTNGGFGQAPKFPQFAFYEWAIEQMLEGMIPKEHGEFIVHSLEKMLMGGINDHVRGGFHRYSTDANFTIPHFEKMLYDQAGLIKVLSKLSLVYPSPLVYDTLISTLDYLENEMLSDEKYFFSAQDSDSEGVEGLFFTFTESEFEDALNQNDTEDEVLAKNMENIKKWFGITTKGNFEHNLNIITLDQKYKEEFFQQQNWDIIRRVKRILLEERKNRLPPVTDNKGIAGWNFSMISSLADVIQYTQIDVIRRMASQLLNSILESIYKTFIVQNENGMRLRHSTTMSASHPYLEDFVPFAESQLRMYEISANPVFKQNFKDSIDFLTREFLDNDKVLTRAKFSNDHELYPNIEYTFFDNSQRSFAATYLFLMKRAYILFEDRNYLDQIKNLEDRISQTILKLNPLGAGEALRALTYPIEVYRIVKLPRAWIELEKYQQFMPYFLGRFVLDYTDEASEWQICNFGTCELKGSGIEEFIKTLSPNEQE
jgi:uncharacterized protein YyaL (SSP411 family)